MSLHRPLALAGLLLLAGAALGPAQQEKFDLNVSIDQVKLGKPVHGPTISDADLKGQVVLMEFWGIS